MIIMAFSHFHQFSSTIANLPNHYFSSVSYCMGIACFRSTTMWREFSGIDWRPHNLYVKVQYHWPCFRNIAFCDGDQLLYMMAICVSFHVNSTHCGLVTPHGDIDVGRYWLKQWLIAWRHQVIEWTNANLSSVRWHSCRRNFMKYTSIIGHWNWLQSYLPKRHSKFAWANELSNRFQDAHILSVILKMSRPGPLTE